jgi:cytochrome c oxidase subunit 2
VRFWSVLFFSMAILCTGAYVYAPTHPDWWLPKNVSTMGVEIDHLFMLILGITGVTFVGTQIALFYVMWKYRSRPDGPKAQYFHGSQQLEVIWTIIPSAILVFIALYQMGTWANVKFQSNKPKVQPLAEVTARQFQWLIKYPGPDGKLGTRDDLHLINDLRFVKGTPALIHLKSRDVLHSFFIPQMRIKQDAVPGLTIPVWFDANEPSAPGKPYELVCAELCGWGHYKMRARVTVYETKSEWQAWMDGALREQARDQVAVASGAGSEGK